MNNAYNMDCMEALQSAPDKYWDLAVVDPPYGINIGKMNMGAGKGKRASKIQNRLWKPADWDKQKPTQEYFRELMRVSRNQIIWGGNYFDLPTCRCFIVWDKGPGIYGRSYSECEYAWTSFDQPSRIFEISPVDKMRVHPTQKPVELYARIYSKYAQPGDRILDTHLGSGSSRIAAYDAGLDFDGYEIGPDYFEAQEERYAAHTAQENLFLQETF